jgi:hypothetical protein
MGACSGLSLTQGQALFYLLFSSRTMFRLGGKLKAAFRRLKKSRHRAGMDKYCHELSA